MVGSIQSVCREDYCNYFVTCGCQLVSFALKSDKNQIDRPKMQLTSDPRVQGVFDKYPDSVKNQLLNLRRLVLDTASEIDGLHKLEETLKWGEPSYLTKHGSTVRMNWKKKSPEQYAIYFKCTSKLVETFRAIYKDKFEFENNRAIVFQLNDSIPEKELKHCIALALTYHKVKQFPLLGA